MNHQINIHAVEASKYELIIKYTTHDRVDESEYTDTYVFVALLKVKVTSL